MKGALQLSYSIWVEILSLSLDYPPDIGFKYMNSETGFQSSTWVEKVTGTILCY